MQVITSSNLHMQMSTISETNHVNKMLGTSTSSKQTDCQTNINLGLTACIRIPRIKLINPPNDYLPNISPTTSTSSPNSEIISNHRHHLSGTDENDNDYVKNYKLSSKLG